MAPDGSDVFNPLGDSKNKQAAYIGNTTAINTHRPDNKSGSAPAKMDDNSPNSKTPDDPKLKAAQLKKKLMDQKSMRASTAQPDRPAGTDSATTSPTDSHVAHPQVPAQQSRQEHLDDITELIRSFSSGAKDNNNQVKAPDCPNGSRSDVPHSTSSPIQKIPGLGSVAPQTPASRTKPLVNPFASNPFAPSPAAQSTMRQAGPTTSKTSKVNEKKTAMTTPQKDAAPKASQAKTAVPTSVTRLQEKTQQGDSIASSTTSVASSAYSPASSQLDRLAQAKTGEATTSIGPNTASDKAGDISKTTDTETVGAMLAKLVERDADLRDWLTCTQYFDVENRNKKLAHYRALVDVEAAERRIKAEQEHVAAMRRKLLEEDDIHQSFFPPTARAGHSGAPGLFAPATPSTNISSADQLHSSMGNGQNNPSTTTKLTLKRGLESDDTEEEQRAKMPKLDTDRLRLNDTKTTKTDDDGPRADRDRGRYNERDNHGTFRDRSPFFPRGDSTRRRSPSHKPYGKFNKYARHDGGYDNENNDLRDTYRYDSYRGGKATRGGWVRTPSPHRRHIRMQDNPKPVDLGGKGDTRFFIIKSANEGNVRMCMKDGIWTTQAHNAETLTTAYATCKNVILFFSINTSKAFQGYARMSTAPSPDTPAPRYAMWAKWDASAPFRVEWLSKTEVQFNFIGHIRNPLNDNLAVLVGKDGQEIEEEAGRALLREMEAIARAQEGDPEGWGDRDRDRNGDHSDRSDQGRWSRGGGGFKIRGRSGKDVKDEDH
ncbi:YT521-B-like domain-containing protein [Coniochaeta sp. 2T2.1]|nr:YT521-B-like domain-containing protein [Coniochaeta sp. 2T2.1]